MQQLKKGEHRIHFCAKMEMKNRMRKSILMITLGVTLLGTTIPVNAAVARNCTAHQGVEIGAGSHTNTYEHTHAAKKCTVVQEYNDYKIMCKNCGAVLYTRSELKKETHTTHN